MASSGCVVVVGIACLDIVNTVSAYPEQDTAVRASSSTRARGGNAANLAAVCSTLGRDDLDLEVAFVGSISDPSEDPAAQFVLSDLTGRGVDTRGVEVHPGCSLPQSYVTVAADTGSRTIVHHRELPELSLGGFQAALDLHSNPCWYHFEGRNLDLVVEMVSLARARLGPHGKISCLLYTSDAADEEDSVDLGGRRCIKKKKY
eukprot:TRINITY_DN39520_c0_g1_i2.p1 TRINITY_DN39520_c0_g1~~TRINITY_DN39520_c0_g1_i2.p1  ORF type:complete len:203 (-),score=18.67 TRINITY_DN39520_c0_g1_i2:47-655(-)